MKPKPFSPDEAERIAQEIQARLERIRRRLDEWDAGDGGGLGVREPRPPRRPLRDGAIALIEPDDEETHERPDQHAALSTAGGGRHRGEG
jgi:hypothetical protein